VAIIAALTTMGGTLLTVWQSTQQTARVSYETLAAASQQNTIAIEACRQGQVELRSWVEELSSRSEQRSVATEKAVARKVTRPAAAPLPPAAPVGPAPKAPPVPAPLAPAELPAFDKLSQKPPG
jgi:porphobilinogen deaminase